VEEMLIGILLLNVILVRIQEMSVETADIMVAPQDVKVMDVTTMVVA